jgi:hypothetical protein
MPLYRSYFVTKEGSIAAWHSFHKDDDEEARGHVLGLFEADDRANKVEVWGGTRMILSYIRATAHTPEDLRALCTRVLDSAHKETDPDIKRSLASYALALAQEAEALEWRMGRERVNGESMQ